MIRLQAPKGATSFVHDRATYEVADGYIEVPNDVVASEAKSHGFIDEKAPPAAATPGGVVIPRADFFAGLKQLGILGAENIPADKLVTAFREGCARQDDRLKFELGSADRRHADRLDQEVTAAEKRGEDRALATLSTKTDETKTETKAGEPEKKA